MTELEKRMTALNAVSALMAAGYTCDDPIGFAHDILLFLFPEILEEVGA